MKQTLLFITMVLMLGSLPAQNIVYNTEWSDSFDEAVLRDRLIVEFRQGTPAASKQLILQLVGLRDAWSLPYPNVTIAKLDRPVADYAELKALIAALHQYNDVKLATPFIHSQGVHPVGILGNISVKVENDIAFQKLLGFAERNHLYPIYPDAYMKNVYWLTTNKYSGYNALEASVMLYQSGLFAFAEPNYLVSPRTAMANDQFYNRQWSIQNDANTVFNNGIIGSNDADMDVDSAWTITTGASFIKVAVLDSGVDTLHPDLIGNILPGYDATGGGSKGYPNINKPNNAHGTACAGIIAATANNGIGIAGVAPDSKIVPIKVFYYIDTTYSGIVLNDIPYSTSQWFANGINWAWREAEADVMSNSWGLDPIAFALLSGSPSLVEEAITAAADSGRYGLGTPMLFSSGNEDTRPIWPSKLANTIAVNATSMCDERKSVSSCDGETWWTGCWGQDLDISAPGVKIYTCDISGTIGYTSGDYEFDFNGTSAACPNAAAVAALILSVRPDLSTDAVRYILGSSADRVGGYNYNITKVAGTWSRELGYGRVNAYKAVLMAQDYTGHQTGIADVVSNTKPMQLYPNPLQGKQITLQFDLVTSSDAMVQIMGLDGRTVYQKSLGQLYDGTNEQTITLDRHLAPGAYLVGLTAGNQTTYSKLVIVDQQ